MAKAASRGRAYLLVPRSTKRTGRSGIVLLLLSHVRMTAEGFSDRNLENLQFNKIHMDDVIGYLYHGESEWLVVLLPVRT